MGGVLPKMQEVRRAEKGRKAARPERMRQREKRRAFSLQKGLRRQQMSKAPDSAPEISRSAWCRPSRRDRVFFEFLNIAGGTSMSTYYDSTKSLEKSSHEVA